jgi:hypothetical protein
MQMIREHDNGIDREWAFSPCSAKCRPQRIDMIDQHR